jgi:hypothetical protein
MRGNAFRQAEVAAKTMHGAVTLLSRDGAGITVEVVSHDGAKEITDDYGVVLDTLCGGSHKNRVVDSISGRRAQIVGAEDTATGRLLCRLCHLGRVAPMGLRFTPLSPQQLAQWVTETEQTHCDECGRELA